MSKPADRWTRVGAVFEEALRLEPPARAEHVARAADGDADVEREVLSLLTAHDEAAGFLDQPAADLGPALLGQRPAVFRPGTVLGPYRVLDELGHGGMGQVFLAEDARLHRRVALKLLDPIHVKSEANRERLRLEARAAAQLSHPGIATVYALEDIDGQPVLAVEFVDGRTLRDRLEDGTPPIGEAVRLALQIARALEAAHAARVVHRDLKPENIMIDSRGSTKILDFGIARIISPDDGDERLTDPGAVVGTPAYMSPEQLRGDDVDVRADQFAFGIVLYELLAGFHPFIGPTRTATQARILTSPPPPLTPGVPALPADLEHIVLKCLEKSPADRYPGTSQLVDDLALVAEGLAGASPCGLPPASGIRLRTGTDPHGWWRFHQAAVMIAVAGMLVTAGWVARWIGGAVQYPLFLGLLACGVAAGTFRAHLLFVERTRPAATLAELRRAMPWLRALDVAFGLTSAAAALVTSPSHPVASSGFLAGAAILVVAVTVIEPATARSAFGSGRKSDPD